MSKEINKLVLENKNAWEKADAKLRQKYSEFAGEYAGFLDASRTERLAVDQLKAQAEKQGFQPIEKVTSWKAGQKVYAINRDKNIFLAVLGREPLENGVHLVASHLDVPRLDLKQKPLYQDDDLSVALLRTHYYGGVKKYQWVNIPLGLYGKVVLGNGQQVDLAIGDGSDDPCFVITDVLPHLNKKEQADRKSSETIRGEEMVVLCGGIPVDDNEAKNRVKLAVLEHLNKKYGMTEEDLISSEIEMVPLMKSRFIGFDRSFLGGYGHDDRICSYTSVRAIFDVKDPVKTAVAACVDKEEIGSEGNTGMRSLFMWNFLGDLMALNDKNYSESSLRKCLSRSRVLSADTNAAAEPNFKAIHEMSNAGRAGYGIMMVKYTGHGGKSGASDANAEFVGWVRKIFNDNDIPWQCGAMGKVDEGGGGTVAKFLAKLGMEVLDCGPAVMSLHSPFEVVSVADIYISYQGYLAFFQAK
jgi:aspartyl aminopeptidase